MTVYQVRLWNGKLVSEETSEVHAQETVELLESVEEPAYYVAKEIRS